MAINNKESGVWSINQVSKKINEKNIWDYKWGASLYLCGYGDDGANGQNNVVNYSSPVQVPGSWGKLTGPLDLGGFLALTQAT